jgi:hypothetical protein
MINKLSYVRDGVIKQDCAKHNWTMARGSAMDPKETIRGNSGSSGDRRAKLVGSAYGDRLCRAGVVVGLCVQRSYKA